MLRKPISKEMDYAAQAAEVLKKQHDRLVTIIEALLQASGWMREGDLSPEEQEMLAAARKFAGRQSKKEAV